MAHPLNRRYNRLSTSAFNSGSEYNLDCQGIRLYKAIAIKEELHSFTPYGLGPAEILMYLTNQDDKAILSKLRLPIKFKQQKPV